MGIPDICPHCGRPIIKETIPFMGEVAIKCPCLVEKEKTEDKNAAEMSKRINSENNLQIFLSNPDIGERYRNKDFQNFQVTEENKKTYDGCVSFVQKFERYKAAGYGIILVGGYGCGKTHLEVAVAKELIKNGYSVSFKKTINLYNEYKNAASWKNDDEVNGFVNRVSESDLLILDDLVGVDDMGNNTSYEQFLYQIIDERYIQKKPLLISTNIPSDMMNRKFTPRIFDRLTAMTSRINNRADSYRQIERKNSLS